MPEKKSLDDLKEELNEPIGSDVIYQKQGLDYVKGGWVVARLNELFGFEGWAWEVVSYDEKENNGVWSTSVHGRLSIPLLGTGRDGLAAGTGRGYDGRHQAIGEGETDALKRAAARLGIQLGGMLYLDDSDPRRGSSPAKKPVRARKKTVSAKPAAKKAPEPDTELYKQLKASVKAAKTEEALQAVVQKIQEGVGQRKISSEQRKDLSNVYHLRQKDIKKEE